MSGQNNQKFNSSDRYKVKEFYERINHGIKLTGIGRKEKYLRDQTDRKYCLLGAREASYHWHGIDEKIINDEKWKNAILIIAIRDNEGIRIYQGLLSEIICNKDRLALVESTSSMKKIYDKVLAAGVSNPIAIKVSGFNPDRAICNQYEFNTEEKEDRLAVKEIPNYSLKKVGTVSL